MGQHPILQVIFPAGSCNTLDSDRSILEFYEKVLICSRFSLLRHELMGSQGQELENARSFSRMTGMALNWLLATPQLVLVCCILASGVKAVL